MVYRRSSDKRVTQNRRICVHVTPELAVVMDEYAHSQGQHCSTWARATLIAVLRAAGIAVPERIAPPSTMKHHVHFEAGRVEAI